MTILSNKIADIIIESDYFGCTLDEWDTIVDNVSMHYPRVVANTHDVDFNDALHALKQRDSWFERGIM